MAGSGARVTHTDIQSKINAGETCVDLPAEEIALPVPLATAGKRIQFNGKGRLETTLIPTTYAIDSTSQSITLNDVGIRGASPTSVSYTHLTLPTNREV